MIVLYDHDSSMEEPSYGTDFTSYVVATLPPIIKRYKSFVNHSSNLLYMPVYTLAELRAIAAYLRRNSNLSAEKFSDEEVYDRFGKFGGIFSAVFKIYSTIQSPIGYNHSHLVQRGVTIKTWGAPPGVSDIILQMIPHYNLILENEDIQTFAQAVALDPPDVNCSAFANQFRSFHYRLASRVVREEFEEDLHTNDWPNLLLKLDSALSRKSEYHPYMFECVVSLMFTRGRNSIPLRWALCPEGRWDSVKFDESSPFFLEETEYRTGDFLRIGTMKPQLLYGSCASQYPVFDMLFKSHNGGIYGLRMTRDPTCSNTLQEYNKFFDQIGLDVESAERFTSIVVTTPDNAQQNYLTKQDWTDWVLLNTQLNQPTSDPSLSQERIKRIKFAVMVPANGCFSPVVRQPIGGAPSSSMD